MTKQIRDILIYNYNEYHLNQEILEKYFREFPEKKPEVESLFTACWRGYVAIFEIKNNELYIKELGMFADSKKDSLTLNTLFPNNNKFEWFSGLLRIDKYRGEFDYEEDKDAIYTLLQINKGDLKSVWNLNYQELIEFKEMIFCEFKKTTDFEKLFTLWRNNNPEMSTVDIEKIIYKDIISHTKEL